MLLGLGLGSTSRVVAMGRADALAVGVAVLEGVSGALLLPEAPGVDAADALALGSAVGPEDEGSLDDAGSPLPASGAAFVDRSSPAAAAPVGCGAVAEEG